MVSIPMKIIDTATKGLASSCGSVCGCCHTKSSYDDHCRVSSKRRFEQLPPKKERLQPANAVRIALETAREMNIRLCLEFEGRIRVLKQR